MMKLLKRWLGRTVEPPAPPDERLLRLEREAQALRLELAEKERAMEVLRKDLERLRKDESDRAGASLKARMEDLLSEIAVPMAQLAAQARLLEVEGKPVQARDVIAVARRLIGVLEDEGLRLEGSLGEAVPFDPNRHELLGGAGEPVPGEKVRIRFAGVRWAGKLLRKAGVERTGG